MSIKLSPKHGLNPTIATCFFCGKDKNELILAGKINRNDDEMPMHTIINYEPCDECKAKMNKGITLIAAATNQHVRTKCQCRTEYTQQVNGVL